MVDFIGALGPEVAEGFSVRKFHEKVKSDPWEGQLYEKVKQVKSGPVGQEPSLPETLLLVLVSAEDTEGYGFEFH